MIFTDLFENTDQPSRVKFRGTNHDIGEERYRFVLNGDVIFFNFPSDEDNPDPDSPSFEEILAKVQRSGEVRHYRITPAEQLAIAKKIAAERKKYLDQRRQDMTEGHADQQRKIVKRNGQPVGEIGIDRESSPGVGQYYMKHYASGLDLSGYDSREEAMDELRYAVKQGVSEAMKSSDIPPSMRDRLTMRDIEAERPEGAFRFRVTFPDGHANDYMTFDAAQAAAEREKGRITRLSETQKTSHKGSRGTNPRLERILKMLRATHPTAQNDLEALILDFRGQQAQDRTDIARLDAENDMEEADIERLEAMLAQLKQRRAAAVSEAAADPQQNRAIVQSLVNPAAQSRMQQHSADFDKMLSQPGYDHRPGVKSELAVSRQQQRQQWIDAVKNLQHWDDPLGVIRIALNKGITVDEVLKNLPAGMDLSALREQKEGVTESLRDGEYHVATVTLDDGTTKKVRITTDEGFRDRIQRHFEKQGRTVTDIDVNYSVRSELDEAKKKPQPTNPELWGRAKAAAKSKFDVYPSAYANAFAAKWYKSKGGGWRMGKPKKD